MSFERRKVRTGTVVSDKMDKTIVVVIAWKQPHRVYRKPVRRVTRLKAHDPNSEAKIGDMVVIRESRPISKTKKWTLVQVLTKGNIAEVQPEEISAPADVLVAQPEAPAKAPEDAEEHPQ